MGEKKQQPSYNTLKESLKCANEEARSYLDALGPLRKENEELEKELKRYKKGYDLQSRIIYALLDLAELRRGVK